MSASPQRGYNHNIAHRGRVYHVQSEDSGSSKSHIYTHVFVGGTIIATNKVDYAAGTDIKDLPAHVAELMQESHKKMIKQLRRGELDQKIEILLGGHPQAEPAGASPGPSKDAAPGPVLAQQKVSRAPPVRRSSTSKIPASLTNDSAEPTQAASYPALRSPLAASPAAAHWLAEQVDRQESANDPVEPADTERATSRPNLDELRARLSQELEAAPRRSVEEELQALFADA